MQMIANMWGFLCAQTDSVIICQQGRVIQATECAIKYTHTYDIHIH